MEQFHGQYIVISIQAITIDGSKVGGGSTQFDVDAMVNSLSSTDQGQLAELFRSKYSPWMATDVDLENRRLNHIFLNLIRYLARPA
jgi:hypothetical protein